MSIVRVDTNVSASDIDESFLIQSTEILAKTFRRPKSEIIVFVNTDQPIIIAGSQEPAAIITLHSVDGINEVDNKHHSAALFPLVTKYLKVKEERISIAFTAVDPYYIGNNGKLFGQ